MGTGRIPSGIEGFDSIIGGFPAGSLIIVAGNPGTGKTVFSAQFIYRGIVDYGENGVYVSFAENREMFYESMKSFGFYFKQLEKEDKFSFLDMVTVRDEGLSSILSMVVEEVRNLNAKRLVIDSFSAMAQAFTEPIDVRIVAHTVLSRIIRQTSCTTLLVVEAPVGEEKIGLGMEEFVADGVIYLKRRILNGTLLRELEILKLRGTEITYPRLAFTLKNGFKVFQPITIKRIEQPAGRYESIPHSKERFSTGIRDLDNYLEKMFTRGGYNLLEIEKDVPVPLELLVRPTVCNFLNQGFGVVILPPQGISAETVKNSLIQYVNERFLKSNLKIADYGAQIREKRLEPYLLPLRGESIYEDLKLFWNAISELREKTRKPVFSIVGYDTVEYTYGEKEALKTLGMDVARIRSLGNLRLNIIRPTIYIADQLRALAHIHLVVEQIDGALFIRGIKPETPILNVETTVENGISRVRLTPIV